MSETKLIIDSLEASDFDTEQPYAYLWSLKDTPFKQDQAFKKMQAKAKELKCAGFLRSWQAYRKQEEKTMLMPTGEITDFTDMPYPVLSSGRWICTNEGVYTVVPERGDVIACPHPILITDRFEDVETGTVKVKLAFKLGHTWRDVIIERSVIASSQKIIQLADLGIGVTSESAKFLVQYLADLEAINYTTIPTKRSVSRLGWINDTTFIPYENGVQFDGQAAFRQMYEAVQPKGSFDKWRDCMLDCLKLDASVRIVMAASFASPLIYPLGILTSIMHLYANTSTGKTMILKMAVSGWGDPKTMIKSFNATAYAVEQYASFCNGIPVFIDELQIAREKHSGAKKVSVYQMTQGSSGGRGRRDGGLRDEKQWRLCYITSGEEPMVSTYDAAGAQARMIEVYLDREIVSMEIGQTVSSIIDRNYGHAGKKYMQTVLAIGPDELLQQYEKITKGLNQYGIQQKQLMSAGALLLAYEIMNGAIFSGQAPALTPQEVLPHLLTTEDVAPAVTAYEQLIEWVAANEHRFTDGTNYERLGDIENDKAYIIRSQFNKFIESINLSPRQVLTGMAEKGLIETTVEAGKTRFDIQKRINGVNVRVVSTNLENYEKPKKGVTASWQGF